MESTSNFLIKIASSSAPIEDLLSEIGRINSGKNTAVQVFDPKMVISQMHLAGAYIDAVESFKDGTNISKSKGMEMLLFAAMTGQISEAIKSVGAKSNKGFVLFANNRTAFNKIRHLLNSERPFAKSKREEQEAAKRFGIYNSEDLDKFVLQRMAVSRLSD